jgi:hypothetical protein
MLVIIAAIYSLKKGSTIVYGETRRISSILSNSRKSSLRSIVLRSPVVFRIVFIVGSEVYPIPS